MLEFERAFTTYKPEEGASQHLIIAQDGRDMRAIKHLFEYGMVVGQADMLTQDVIYYLNPERRKPKVIFVKK